MPKALFITGGWEGHQPQLCADIFVDFLKSKGWQVHISETLDILLDSEIMHDLSLIIPVWTMGQITEEQSKALRNVVLSGVGLAGWHGGMCDSFRNDTEYQFMTGGQWVVHPGNIISYRVDIRHDSSGFMVGLKDFEIESEQYYMHVDPSNEVLATTTFTGRHGDTPWIKGTVMPAVWKRIYGKGRVFYSSLGHVAKDFEIPEVKEIVKRGLQWAAGQPVLTEYQSK
jgi:type 1 glutamine amidotransferase